MTNIFAQYCYARAHKCVFMNCYVCAGIYGYSRVGDVGELIAHNRYVGTVCQLDIGYKVT